MEDMQRIEQQYLTTVLVRFLFCQCCLAGAAHVLHTAFKQHSNCMCDKLILHSGGDAAATQKWLDTAGGQRTKPQNVWTQQKVDKPSQWANGTLTDRDRAVKDAWAKQ